MDDYDDMLYREMNPHDPYYMGPDDHDNYSSDDDEEAAPGGYYRRDKGIQKWPSAQPVNQNGQQSICQSGPKSSSQSISQKSNQSGAPQSKMAPMVPRLWHSVRVPPVKRPPVFSRQGLRIADVTIDWVAFAICVATVAGIIAVLMM
ncbi:MAG: hypothetical protein LIP03_11215 [Bacteroidales bacterium]|nr:hypothetical protein [Bacteroidales bacterium]